MVALSRPSAIDIRSGPFFVHVRGRMPFVTVSDLIEILQRLPATARVVVQGYESGFNDATGATPQPIVVNGGFRERDCVGPYVPTVQGGGGDHETSEETGVPANEVAMFITSTQKR